LPPVPEKFTASLGHDAEQPAHITHLSESIRFSGALAQFIGQTRSHIPHEMQRDASILARNGAIPEANPRTIPAGHQSQNLLPLTHAKNKIATKIAAYAAYIGEIFPLINSIAEVTPRPKFDIGSVSMKSEGTEKTIPAAAMTGTA
jgi:hypothetical protein